MQKIMCFFLLLFNITVWAKPVEIVAAENFYGSVAKEIGGPYVNVISIISNPKQDPHLFSASVKNAKAINDANIIVYNGIGYDDWMQKLLSAKNQTGKIINVADIVSKQSSNNPHIWYSPETMPIYATYLTQQLSELDPAHADKFNQRLAIFKKKYASLTALIEKIRQENAHKPVVATEPVFGYMADALGLKMYDQAFQISVMNNVEPSAADTRDIESRLKTHEVKVLIYNDQVMNPTTEQVKSVAKNAGVPMVGVSETQPTNKTYIAWMTEELQKLQAALRQTK